MEEFAKEIKELADLRNKLPRMIGVEAVGFFKDRFRYKGWLTAGDWKKSKKNPNTLVGKQSGRLRRSIRITKISHNSVTIGTDVPYAKIHNEGGRIQASARVREHTRKRLVGRGRGADGRLTRGTLKEIKVKAHTRRINMLMPKRQFMGEHPLLDKKIKYLAYKSIKDIIEKYK